VAGGGGREERRGGAAGASGTKLARRRSRGPASVGDAAGYFWAVGR
jgi:hypothetical protein